MRGRLYIFSDTFVYIYENNDLSRRIGSENEVAGRGKRGGGRRCAFYRMEKSERGAGDDFSAKISFSRIAIEPCAGCRTQTYSDVVVAAVSSHRRRRFLLQIGDDNAERWLGSLNYMRQSKFVRFARRLIILIVRARRSIHFVFYGDVHCFTSHVRRRLTTKSVCARDTLRENGTGTSRNVR